MTGQMVKAVADLQSAFMTRQVPGNAATTPAKGLLPTLVRWVDADHLPEGPEAMLAAPKEVDWARCVPFILLHLACLGVFWTGASPVAVWTAVALYFIRMFAITGFLHRYFSHRTFSTSRAFQFIMALWTATAVQRGALWWASTHRHHHRHSDDPEDKHSPVVDGFWWSHVGWITAKRNFPTDYGRVPDLAKYPELVFLNRFDVLVPVLFFGALYGAGAWMESAGVATSGAQMLVWGVVSTVVLFLNRFDVLVPVLFFGALYGAGAWMESAGVATSGAQMLVWGVVSTVVLFHGTACINSLAHVFGRRRFLHTGDDSRNSLLLSLITLGEGWHNNHHRYQATVRQGFFWWEFDPTWYLLKALSWTGLIWGLKPVPASVYAEAAGAADAAGTAEEAEQSA